MKTDYEYLSFRKLSILYKKWDITNKKEESLGIIKWSDDMRQYTFVSGYDISFSSPELQDICSFINQLQLEY